MTNLNLDPSREDQLENEVGPPGFWKQTRDFQIQFLKDKGLKPENKLLEIGCGVLRGGLPVIDYLDSHGYTGLDIRPTVIDESRKLVSQFELDDKHPKLIQANCFGVSVLQASQFDFIWAFQVFYHLDDELVKTCLRACAQLMKPDGILFANIHPDISKPSGSWKEFPFIPRPVQTYEEWAIRAGLACSDLGTLGSLGYTKELAGHQNQMLELRLTST